MTAGSVFAWVAFLGAWLLVAGPVYQAAIELREEEAARAAVAAAHDKVEAPAPISPWWWLLPPVRYRLAVRRQRSARRALAAALDADQLRAVVRYLEKATGWLLVAAGALLIATAETGALVEHLEWPGWTFWAAAVVMAGLVLGGVAVRMRTSTGVLAAARADGVR